MSSKREIWKTLCTFVALNMTRLKPCCHIIYVCKLRSNCLANSFWIIYLRKIVMKKRVFRSQLLHTYLPSANQKAIANGPISKNNTGFKINLQRNLSIDDRFHGRLIAQKAADFMVTKRNFCT